METPQVIHPKKIAAKGCTFEVLSYSQLTDREATEVIRQFLKRHRIGSRDRGKLIRVATIYDQETSAMLL